MRGFKMILERRVRRAARERISFAGTIDDVFAKRRRGKHDDLHLTVVTPMAAPLKVRPSASSAAPLMATLAILAKHGDYCTALGMGEGTFVDAAACMGGLSSVLDGDVRLVYYWEWAEDIDQRVRGFQEARREILARKNLNDCEYELAQARSSARWRTSVR